MDYVVSSVAVWGGRPVSELPLRLSVSRAGAALAHVHRLLPEQTQVGVHRIRVHRDVF